MNRHIFFTIFNYLIFNTTKRIFSLINDIHMKKGRLLLIFPVYILLACNSNTKTTSTADSSSAITQVPDTKTDSGGKADKKIISAIDTTDPDPSDTIPASGYGVNTMSKKTAGLISSVLPVILKENYKFISKENRRFIFFETDLNNDGSNEIFVGFNGMDFCGTGGCTALLLTADGKLIDYFTVADYPFIIYNEKTKGWKNLVVRSNHADRLLTWTGSKYPSNPSLAPKYKGLPSDEAPRALWWTQYPYPWFKF
jgi:hypothetical protein